MPKNNSHFSEGRLCLLCQLQKQPQNKFIPGRENTK
nr:MAG TPA: hypothetical protein [Bacteriophage sp.]